MDRLRSYVWTVPLFAVSTIGFAVVSLCSSFFDATGNLQHRIASAWGKTLLWIAGAPMSVEGLEHLDPNANYVFTANHLSYMDTPAVLAQLRAQFRFLAKQELFSWPGIGWHLQRAGHIPVPLDDPRARIRTLNMAVEMIHRKKISLLIFPEGGRSEDGELQDFKAGAAFFAIKAQVPLVPMALLGTREVLPMHSLIFRSHPVKLIVGRPIPTAGMTIKQRGELSDQVRDQISCMLAEGGEGN